MNEYCSCSGIQKNMCTCHILSNVCNHDPNNLNIIFVSNKRHLDYRTERRKSGIFSKFLQNVYEMCVGYNIRYCAITGGYSKDRMIKHAFKDWVLLLCFLVTNTVVFLSLVTRIIYNTSSIIFNLLTWTRRTLSKKLKIYLGSEYSQKGIKHLKYSVVSEKYKSTK